ncbi:hypothetical protein [Aporhodopirellula aestuarii]|uniref:hypothetical protein n=1 Tax=Aporhodopirellula aestuarii TaxID=2950107 RepID=UPI00389922CD
MLEHLMRGSQNHLRAFASQILQQGLSYNADFQTQVAFDIHIAEPLETELREKWRCPARSRESRQRTTVWIPRSECRWPTGGDTRRRGS